MFSKPAVLGALARFVLNAYVAMVCLATYFNNQSEQVLFSLFSHSGLKPKPILITLPRVFPRLAPVA